VGACYVPAGAHFAPDLPSSASEGLYAYKLGRRCDGWEGPFCRAVTYEQIKPTGEFVIFAERKYLEVSVFIIYH
jgi:hypothetical protein